MAEPTITMEYNDGSDAVPSWTTIAGGEVITFTGPGSSDGDLKPITAPIAGVRVADELWIDKGTDAEVSLYDGGGQEVGDFVTDVFTINPAITNIFAILASTNSESSAGILRAWDDTNYNTTALESLTGTTNMVESFWRACETASNVATSAAEGSIPGAYLTQTANTTTYCLEGSTYELQFTTALTAGNQNRFLLHFLLPDDASNPVEASRTVEINYHYFYT